MREAQTMLRDEDAQIENARKYVADHPSLYKQLLEMKLASVEEPDSGGRVNSSEGVDSGKGVAFGEEADSSENEKMLRLGMEALDKIPHSYVIRSEIALLTAEYACKLQDKAAMETCWLEAFRSDSTVTNYLRVKLQTENWKKYEDAVNTICEQVYKRRKKNARAEISYLIGTSREKTICIKMNTA